MIRDLNIKDSPAFKKSLFRTLLKQRETVRPVLMIQPSAPGLPRGVRVWIRDLMDEDELEARSLTDSGFFGFEDEEHESD
jgi:hypothetical protein